MRIALLGVYPVISFAKQLGITNPDTNVTSPNVNLAKALAAIRGNEVHFITTNTSIRRDIIIRSEGVHIHFLVVPKKIRLVTLFQYNKMKVHKELSKIQPDIVHGRGTEHEYPYFAVTANFPNVITFQNYVPLIIQHDGWSPFFLKWLVMLLFEKYVLKKAKYIISTTKFLDDMISKHTNAKRFIIGNPVSPVYFSTRK